MTSITKYLHYQPDYYNGPVFHDSCLENIAASARGRYLCLSKNGLSTASKIYCLWQKFLGMLGFTDHCNPTLVTYETLKFLFFHWPNKDATLSHYTHLIAKINNKIQTGSLIVSDTVRTVFFRLSNLNLNHDREEAYTYLREKLISYYRENETKLQPSFWNSFHEETIKLPKKHHFGDTSLAIAERESLIQEKKASPCLGIILHEYSQAADRYNSDDPEFTNRLSKSLNKFVTTFKIYPQTENPSNKAISKAVGKIYFQIASNEKRRKNYEAFCENFLKAVAYTHGTFTPLEALIYLDVCLQMKKTDTSIYRGLTEKINALNVENLKKSEKTMYCRVYHKLGDYELEQSKVPGIFGYAFMNHYLNLAKGHYLKALKQEEREEERALIQLKIDAVEKKLLEFKENKGVMKSEKIDVKEEEKENKDAKITIIITPAEKKTATSPKIKSPPCRVDSY